MRILLYNSHPEWTGSARVFAAVANGLGARGHTVTYACVARSPVERRLDSTALEVLPIAGGGLAIEAFRLRKALQERFVDVLIVGSERDHLTGAAAARVGERIPMLRRVPHDEPARGGSRLRLALRLAPVTVLFASDYERRQAPPPLRAAESSNVVPLGVDVAGYADVRPLSRASIGAPDNSRLMVCVYDSGSDRRAATVLRVMAMLAPLHPALRLAFVGMGSDNDDLRMHAAALRITSLVSFLGEHRDYRSVLKAADLGWVVAAGDTAAYALLDLLALEVPVLTDGSPLARQYIADGIAGVLLAPGDANDCAAAIARLLAHDEERSAMASAGRARAARDFTERAMIEAFERLMENAIERGRPAR